MDFPAHSWNTHVHIFNPKTHPFRADRQYTPDCSISLDETISAHTGSSCCTNYVVVQASFEDGMGGVLNTLSQAAAQHPSRVLRGEVFWQEEEDETKKKEKKLDEMHKAGVRCLRLHAEYGNNAPADAGAGAGAARDYLEWTLNSIRKLCDVAKPRGWAVAAQLPLEMWLAVLAELERVGDRYAGRSAEKADPLAALGNVPLIAEHLGSPPPLPLSEAHQAQYDAFIDYLSRSTSFYVKLSALHRRRALSSSSPDTIIPLISQLATRAPHALLYGSDFPHVDVETRSMSPTPLLKVDHVQEAETIRRAMSHEAWFAMMVENPARIFA